MTRIAMTLCAAMIAGLGMSGAEAQETREEQKYADELKACAQRPTDAERKSCEAAVREKIRQEWRARIESESRRFRPSP